MKRVVYNPTRHLVLGRDRDGYHRTQWTDLQGEKHRKSFGKNRNEAKARFAEFHARWLREPSLRTPRMTSGLNVRQAYAVFDKFARGYYVKNGAETGEADNIKLAMRETLALFGDLQASLFDVLGLKRVQDEMVLAGLTVQGVNQRIGKIRHVFRWLASQHIVPASVALELTTLSPLRKGRPIEIEGKQYTPVSTEKVKPVPTADILAAKEQLPRSIQDMIDLQLLSGARPGELCAMTPRHLDTGSEIMWVCRPPHKTEHHGIEREIFFGPKAIAILRRYHSQVDDTAAADRPLFSPAKAWAERQERRRSLYVPPQKAGGDYRTWKSNQGRNKSGRGGARWNAKAYARAIARACKEAKVKPWSPNQLRHNAATLLRAQYGIETAQAVLGHVKLDTTQVYAEKQREKAKKAISEIG